MSLSNPKDQQGKKNDYEGVTFIGTVVENKDPSKLMRIKVSIPELMTGGADDLPWAIPFTSDFDRVKIPEIGNPVYCILQKGDKHYPAYLGEQTGSSHVIPSILATNYPDRYGMQDSKGNYNYVDKKTGDVEIAHHTGTLVHIDPSGNIAVTGVDNATISITGNVNLTVNGSLTANVSGSITSSAASWAHTGSIVVNGEVTANGIPLSTHLQSGVTPGPIFSLSGPPVP